RRNDRAPDPQRGDQGGRPARPRPRDPLPEQAQGARKRLKSHVRGLTPDVAKTGVSHLQAAQHALMSLSRAFGTKPVRNGHGWGLTPDVSKTDTAQAVSRATPLSFQTTWRHPASSFRRREPGGSSLPASAASPPSTAPSRSCTSATRARSTSTPSVS